MPSLRILVCEAQVPFVHGGAEVHVRELVRELRERGYQAELVSVPFKWYPKEEILPHAAAWRLLDLSESNGQPIDLVIASKFPTYFVRHPRKVAWLIHQYRAAYELCGTEYSDFSARRVGRRAARPPDPARHRDARRVPGDLRERAQHRAAAGEVQRPVGRGALPSAAARVAAAIRAVRRLRAVGRPHRIGEASGPARPRDGPRRPADSTDRRRRRHAASQCRAARARRPASPTGSRFSGRRTTRS